MAAKEPPLGLEVNRLTDFLSWFRSQVKHGLGRRALGSSDEDWQVRVKSSWTSGTSYGDAPVSLTLESLARKDVDLKLQKKLSDSIDAENGSCCSVNRGHYHAGAASKNPATATQLSLEPGVTAGQGSTWTGSPSESKFVLHG